MGFITKLCFLLLFGSCVVAQGRSDDKETAPCLKRTTRFKNLKTYFYNYEAETSNGIAETASSRSGVHISCRVELEVPQYCAYSMQIKACTLKEVSGISADGKPNFVLSKDTEEFQQAMSKYELKFTTYGHLSVNLYPSKSETANILNIKRGIISALLLPMESNEDVQTFDIATVYGNCTSEVTVNNRVNNVATQMTVKRDLTACNRFTPTTDYRSPLALLTGTHMAMSSFLSSSQSCSYSLDVKKHVTEAICNEKHNFLSLSNENPHGVVSQVKQTLKLENFSPSNTRYFANDESTIMKELTLEHADSRAKNADSALSSLQDLVRLPESGSNQQRANLFQTFVVELRRIEKDTFETALPKLNEIDASRLVTFQALLQCGTPECFGAILKILQSDQFPPMVADAVTYAIGLMASPSASMIQETLNQAKLRHTRGIFYALSHTIRKFYDETKSVVPELKAVADYLMSIIGSDCSGDEDSVYLTLKALGNMGQAMENAIPGINANLIACINNSNVSPSIQQAAIQALRQITLNNELRNVLLEVFKDVKGSVSRRLGAYLMVMKEPSSNHLKKIARYLPKIENIQVKNFVSTHLSNILKSEAPNVQVLKNKLSDALRDIHLPGPMNFRKFSRNYNVYKKINLPGKQDALAAGLQSNVIFEQGEYLPRSVMLETTLNVFGESMDLFEFGLDGNGFEPSLEAIFGSKGFFPDSAKKALYWMNGKVPDKVSQVMFNWFGISKDGEDSEQDLMKKLTDNFHKMLKKFEEQTPEAEAFLRIFGNELGYIKGSDFKLPREMMSNAFQLFRSLPPKLMAALQKGINSDLFAHYIFMDTQFNLPTGAGLPLKLSLSGTIAPGAKAGIRFSGKKSEGLIKPAVAIEFVTQLGVNVPNFARNGIQINQNLYHESGFEARIKKSNNQIKFSIPAPKEPIKLLSISNGLSLIHNTKTEKIAFLTEKGQTWKSCKPLFIGVAICSSATYPDTPSCPLTGELRFEVEIEPTANVRNYAAAVAYQSQRIEEELEHSLKFTVQAEGSENAEATAEIKYNVNQQTFTGDVQIPKFDVELGMKLGIEDKSAPQNTAYVVKLDITNRNVPEVTLTGRARYNNEQKDLLLQGIFSIPQLDINTNVGTQIRHSSDESFTEFNIEASIPYLKASYRTNYKYDNKKIQVAWDSEVTSDLKPINEKIRNMEMPDMSQYQKDVNNYFDKLFNQQLPETDMNLKHILDKSMEAGNSWLQQAALNNPHVDTFQRNLKALGTVDFEKIKSYFNPPENLFLKSHGSIAGTLSGNKWTIKVPIPFGAIVTKGSSFFSKILSAQPMVMKVLGMNSNEYGKPPVEEDTSTQTITIPEIYNLHIPSINKLEFSTQMNSNYYKYSSNFTTDNSDRKQFSADVDIRAVSALDYLSYHLKGSALSKQDAEDMLTRSISSSFQHKLLESSIKLSQKYNSPDEILIETTYECDALSNLGTKGSLRSWYKIDMNKSPIIKMEGQSAGTLNVASYDATLNYRTSETIDPINQEGKGDSTLNFNSAFLQVTNKMNGEYNKDVVTFSSNTEGSWLNLKNVIKMNSRAKKFELKCDTSGEFSNGNFSSNIKLIKSAEVLKVVNKLRGELYGATLETKDELNYREDRLSLFLNSTGKYNKVATTNSLSLLVLEEHVEVEHKWNADYYDKKFHSILSGTFNDGALELKSDTAFAGVANQGILKYDNGALSTEVTSSVNMRSFMLKHVFTTVINQHGVIMSIGINDQKSNLINLNMEGKANSGGIYITSSGVILQTKATNTIDLQFNGEKGLMFNTMTKALFKETTFNHINNITIGSWTLTASNTIETGSYLDSNNKYQQKFEVHMRPFIVSINFDNKFQYQQLHASHIVQLSLEPFKVELKGELTGSQKENRLVHIYILKYADLKTLLSANTTGRLNNMNINHRLNLEINGLSAKFSSDMSSTSRALKFQNNVRFTAIPFVLTFSADTSAKGSINGWGLHSGELNNKLQMKAEPLAIALHHDFKGISEHELADRRLKSLLENSLNILLIPTEQESKWIIKSQLNNNTYMQTINAYNDPEKIGIDIASNAEVDFSCLKEVNFLPSKVLEFVDQAGLQTIQISGTLKYDKNGDVHVIDIPFLEHLPAYFESFKVVILNTLEGIQNYLKDIQINQFVQKCKKALTQMSDFIRDMNLDIKVNDARDKVLVFVREYQLLPEYLKSALIQVHNSTLTNLQEALFNLKGYDKTKLKEAIANFINLTLNALIEIDQNYAVSKKTANAIIQMQEVLSRYYQNAVQSNFADWIQGLEEEYQIKAQLQDMLKELHLQLQNINLQEFADGLTQQINLNALIEKLEQYLNTYDQEIKKKIKNIYEGILWLLEHYEINDKINSINAKMQQVITTYEIDILVQKLLAETVKLVQTSKIKDTIQGAIISLKKSLGKSYNGIIQYIDDATEQIKLYDYQKLIDKINGLLNIIITNLRQFDYNAFVDERNAQILSIINDIKDKMEDLEIPQKVKSVKFFLQEIQSYMVHYIERLQQKNMAELISPLIGVLRSIVTSFQNYLEATFGDILEDLRVRINEMDIQEELQIYWQDAVNYYKTIASHISAAYDYVKIEMMFLATRYDFKEVVNQIEMYLEEGFIVPELDIGVIFIPAFEISIRAIRKGEFDTPSFTVPLTNLHIRSYHINLNNLNEIRIPSTFEIPPFVILDSIFVPAITIDLEKIKNFTLPTIENILNSEIFIGEFNTLSDLNFLAMSLPDVTFPEIDFSAFHIPDISKVNLDHFLLDDIQIPEFQFPRIPLKVSVPAFGKLSGTFTFNCPVYGLHTTAGIHNINIVKNSTELLAFITAKGISSVSALSFDLEANARLSAPEQTHLELSESITFDHTAITIGHMGNLTFTRPFVNGKAETKIKITTEAYNAETINIATMKIQKALSTKMQTTYSHNLNVPHKQLSSQVSLLNIIQTSPNEKNAALSITTTANGKWSFQGYSDEGAHKSELKLNLDAPALIVAFSGDTNTKYIKMKQSFKTEIAPSFSARLTLNSEANFADVVVCFVTANGKADLVPLKVELRGSHKTNLNGRAVGTVANSFRFTAEPFAVGFEAKNSADVKVSFPLTLIGKLEFLNNYELTLNPNEQQFSWQVNSTFNQYKYMHDIYVANSEENISMHLKLNGDANLDFLTLPISIPEISLPYSSFRIRPVRNYSLWEHTNLKNLLRTTRQSLGLSIKTEYRKNKDFHSFKIDMEPLYSKINDYLTTSAYRFRHARNNILKLLKKIQHDGLQENSATRMLHIPGYTIPGLNIEVSSYRLEIPVFNFDTTRTITTPTFKLPIINFIMPSYTFAIPFLGLKLIHIPDSLYTLPFPRIKMPRIQDTIKVPAMGNLTYDFSLKSSLVVFNSHFELFNQSDIIARYSVSSSSIFTSNFKAEGTTSLARRRGLKLATTISVNHDTIRGNHDSTVTLTKRNMEASISTGALIKLFDGFVLNFKHNLNGKAKPTPNVQSKISLKYSLSVPSTDNEVPIVQGSVIHSLTLADFASYLNLETSTNAHIEGTMQYKFFGNMNNEASIYLSSNNTRSSVKLELSSSVDSTSGNVWNMTTNENLAVATSKDQIYATWDHSADNILTLPSVFETNGHQKSKATLELAFWSLTAKLQTEIDQTSDLWQKADVQSDIAVIIKPEMQKVKWNNNGHLLSAVFSDEVELLNNGAEIHLDLTGSLQGYVNFLKQIELPLYEKSFWDILKFDLTTSEEERQYLNVSALIVFTKSENNLFIPLPTQMLANGLKIHIPEITLHIPEWVKNVPEMIPQIANFHIPDEIEFPTIIIPLINVVVPSYKSQFPELKLPRIIITPEFMVPYTTLRVPSYTINLTDIAIPPKINFLPFDLTLPNLPTVSFPKVTVHSTYLELSGYMIPYLEIAVPEFKISVSQFDLPKSFKIAGHYLQLDNIAKQIANFELPTITIPAKTVEIPPLKAKLPLALVLPAFKSFTGNVKVLSPIYNTTWITSVKSDQNRADILIAAVDATSSSTLRFLEYEIDASATLSTTINTYNLDGKYTFAHPDLSIDWKQNCTFQRSGLTSYLRVDVTSPTFTDLNIRWRENNGEITSSVSSPATGFIGLVIKRKGSNVLNGKLYIHKPISSEIVILASKVSLENPESINMQFNWANDVTTDMVNGLKERIPRMIQAIYKCVNKYHTEHLGIEMSVVSSKGKDLIKLGVDEAFTKARNRIKEVGIFLQSTVDTASQYQKVKEATNKLFKRAADKVANVDFEQKVTTLLDAISNLTQEYQSKLKDLIEAAIKFLKYTKFQLPGLADQYTGQELYTMSINHGTQLFVKFDNIVKDHLENAVEYIRELEFNMVPGNNSTIKASEILSQLGGSLKQVLTKVIDVLTKMSRLDVEQYLNFLKSYIQTWSEDLINANVASANILKQEVKFITNSTEYFNTYFKYSLTGFQEFGKGTIPEYIKTVNEFLNRTFSDINNQIPAYKRTIKTKLDEAILKLNEPYEELIAQGAYAVNVFIENFSKFTEQLFRFLEQIANKLTDGMELYVKKQPGQLIINVPHPLKWKSFDDVPQLNERTLSKLHIKGQQILQRSTALTWQQIMESYQKDKKSLNGKKTKNKSKF
ncbi:apolipoprotein B-100 [Scyliorhinus torazame]|uniref:apolipoprotein B-100 n=1 Tax=Scyliorhinus torazame TaxID=75743 RepID=UPI003B5A6EC3